MKDKFYVKVKLFRVEVDAAPFIEVDYVDKNAEEQTGLLLLDSCSMGNILCPEMVDRIGMLCKVEDEGTKLYSIAHETMEAENVRFHFSFGEAFGRISSASLHVRFLLKCKVWMSLVFLASDF